MLNMQGVVVESRSQLWAWGSSSHNLQEEILVQGHHNSFEMDHYGTYAWHGLSRAEMGCNSEFLIRAQVCKKK